MKKRVEKKKYSKPFVKKNEPLVNITFATAGVGAGAVPGTGGAAGPAIG
jgi:hypothetical protein